MSHLPPTSPEKLKLAYEIGKKAGLRYIYVGNVDLPDLAQTYCPKCHSPVISRRGMTVVRINLKDGHCEFCGQKIAGVF